MDIVCPACAAELVVPDSSAGEECTCPQCGFVIAVPSTKPCPFCGEQILSVAIKCKHCQSMLDGSHQQHNVPVSVTQIDPFAELHTPIQGKTTGNLTCIGALGICFGILTMATSALLLFSGKPVEAEEVTMMFLVGLGFVLASYSWARRSPRTLTPDVSAHRQTATRTPSDPPPLRKPRLPKVKLRRTPPT